jgi:hypothetical protein
MIAVCSLVILIVTGCSSTAAVTPTAGGVGSRGSTSGTTTAPPITSSSIYAVASGFVTDRNWSPDSILIFSNATAGTLDDEVPNWELAGSHVSLDSGGDIYVLRNGEIDVIPPAAPYLSRSRFLLVPGPKIAAVKDMVASLIGEIFVSDGKGIAVFSASATGNDDPVRYIQGYSQTEGGSSTPITPGVIAVDAADNLYVQNTADSSIVVFGPTDTGSVAPSRTIAGPVARLTSNGSHVMGITTDTAGNLYVLCQCSRPDGSGSDVGVIEFNPTANGNVAPIRFVSAPEMDSSFLGSGIAVDQAGTIYVSGNARILEFSATASGIVAPSNSVTSAYGSLLGIAVH